MGNWSSGLWSFLSISCLEGVRGSIPRFSSFFWQRLAAGASGKRYEWNWRKVTFCYPRFWYFLFGHELISWVCQTVGGRMQLLCRTLHYRTDPLIDTPSAHTKQKSHPVFYGCRSYLLSWAFKVYPIPLWHFDARIHMESYKTKDCTTFHNARAIICRRRRPVVCKS